MTNAALPHVSRLGALRDLDLWWTELDGSGLLYLRDLRGLRRLALAGVPITEAEAGALVGLGLRRLDVRGTGLSLDVVARIKSSMPGCLVSRAA